MRMACCKIYTVIDYYYYYAIHHFCTDLDWQRNFIPYIFILGDIIKLQNIFSKE